MPDMSAAELAIVATLVNEPIDALPPFMALLVEHAPEPFTTPVAGAVAAVVRSLRRSGTPIDAMTVASDLPFHSGMEFGARDLITLPEPIPPENAEHHAKVIWESFTGRRLKASLLDAVVALEESGNPVLVAKGISGVLEIVRAETGSRIAARPWIDITLPDDDDSVLIGPGRWLTRGSGCFITAPTGIGKSTFSATLSFTFALGRACLGFVPTKPMKSLIIQAEDDDGDLIKMRSGILHTLAPTAADKEQLRCNVVVHTEKSDTGADFLRKVVQPLLEDVRPDLLWLNPVSAFFGDDLNDQRAVAKFFRNGLNPLLARYRCAAFPIHHTGKPTKEKSGWSDGAAAYLSAGHSDLANWSRETITLREVVPGLFEMACSKRWRHLGWTDPEGRPTRVRRVAYGEGGLQYWRDGTPDVLADFSARQYSDAALVALIPTDGVDKTELVRQAVEEFSIAERTAKNYVSDLSRVRNRLVKGTRTKCALVREIERPRREVYPDRKGNRPVVWLTTITTAEPGSSAKSSAEVVQADLLAQPPPESASGGSGATHSLSVALPPETAGEANPVR